MLARVEDHDEIEVIAEAHRVLPGGVLSGYDLSSTPPNSRLEPEERRDQRTRSSETGVSTARFVDSSAAVAAADTDADAVQSWRGTVSTEELPGGGLHKHVSPFYNLQPVSSVQREAAIYLTSGGIP